VFLPIVIQLLGTANIPSSPILSTMMMEAIHSSETSVLPSATRCHFPEDGILHNFSIYCGVEGVHICFVVVDNNVWFLLPLGVMCVRCCHRHLKCIASQGWGDKPEVQIVNSHLDI
jgi:hypothetical protein